MDPSGYPELRPYPSLRELISVQIDMYFRDLRTMLQLPRRDLGLDGGCNFAAARQCFDVIAGASVLFYDSSVQALHDRQDRGRRFKGVLAQFYPWVNGYDSLTDVSGADLVYTMARNPLVHSLGVVGRRGAVGQEAGDFPMFYISKPVLDAASVAEVEEALELPRWMDPTLHHAGCFAGRDIYNLSVPTLAWGLHRMLQRLFADEAQATRAEDTARQLLE